MLQLLKRIKEEVIFNKEMLVGLTLSDGDRVHLALCDLHIQTQDEDVSSAWTLLSNLPN